MPSFTLPSFLSNIQNFRVTFVSVAPPVVLALAKAPIVDDYDLSSLRMCGSGAAPLSAALSKAVYDRTGIRVKQGYGMTEASPSTHIQCWEDWDVHAGAVGRLVPNNTAKFISEDGKELPLGQTGELCIKGPNIFLGYLHNAKGTKEAFCPDGFYKTGDVGHEDTHGNLFITDRVKELIKYKGFQVAPAELEGLLQSMQDVVQDVAVTGIWDTKLQTEVPRAWVVVKPGIARDAATADRIVTWCAGQVSNHKQLRGGVRFLDMVPKSPSGKILRRVLRDRVLQEEKSAKPKL